MNEALQITFCKAKAERSVRLMKQGGELNPAQNDGCGGALYGNAGVRRMEA